MHYVIFLLKGGLAYLGICSKSMDIVWVMHVQSRGSNKVFIAKKNKGMKNEKANWVNFK
jgi:hypothetical protein